MIKVYFSLSKIDVSDDLQWFSFKCLLKDLGCFLVASFSLSLSSPRTVLLRISLQMGKSLEDLM